MCPAATSFKFVLVQEKAPPAQRVLNNEIDRYKEQIRRLYLEENLTRVEVIQRLRDQGFQISPDQFSKATKRWGFKKQSQRHLQPIHGVDSGERPAIIDSKMSQDLSTLENLREPSVFIELNKRARSPADQLATFDHRGGALRSYPYHPTKRCRPSFQHKTDVVGISKCCDDSLASEGKRSHPDCSENVGIETRPSTQLLVTSEMFPSRIDWLRVQYLTCCYFFEPAFYIIYKGFIDGKTLKGNMMTIWLHLVRAAKSKHARNLICEALESPRVQPDDFFRSPNVPEMLNMESRNRLEACQERFQFHRNVARIYSYYPDKLNEVKKHLKLSRSFMSRECIRQICDSKCLDLWTLYHLLEGRGAGTGASVGKSTDDWLIAVDPSQISHPDPWTTRHPLHTRDGTFIPEEFIHALEPDLCGAMIPFLTWCKSQLELGLCTQGPEGLDKSIHVSQDVFSATNGNLCPGLVSNWKYNWNSMVLWVRSSQLFSYLWPRMNLGNMLECIESHGIISREIHSTHWLMIICRLIIDELRFLSSPSHIDNDGTGGECLKSGKTFVETNLDSCLQAISLLLNQCKHSPTAATARFVHQFCDHHSGPSSIKYESQLTQSVQDELLETFECRTENFADIEKATYKSTLGTPVVPRLNLDWVIDLINKEIAEKQPRTDRSESMASMGQGVAARGSSMNSSSIMASDILLENRRFLDSLRRTSTSNRSTISCVSLPSRSSDSGSFLANERFLDALRRTSRTDSESSRISSSRPSDSSSLRRFMEARDAISKARTELLQPQRPSSEFGSAYDCFGDEGAGTSASWQLPARDEGANNTQGVQGSRSLVHRLGLRRIWGGKE